MITAVYEVVYTKKHRTKGGCKTKTITEYIVSTNLCDLFGHGSVEEIRAHIAKECKGKVVSCEKGLSFWGVIKVNFEKAWNHITKKGK